MKYKMFLKWRYRIMLNTLNKLLLHFFTKEQLKTWNARLLHHRKINLKHPEKLNEKVIYYAYHEDQELLGRLADKTAVREYVKDKGMEEILVPIIGIYNNYADIPWEKLPRSFVLKASYGSNMVYLCHDKKSINLKALNQTIQFWMTHNLCYMSLEMHYASIAPRILCEKLLDAEKNMIDYKFFCLNGNVSFIEVCSNRSSSLCLNLYDSCWNPIPDSICGISECKDVLPKPERLSEMIDIAEKLAESFDFVRIDLYLVDHQIYFGEMTFTPATGLLFHFTEEFLKEQGGKLKLTIK